MARRATARWHVARVRGASSHSRRPAPWPPSRRGQPSPVAPWLSRPVPLHDDSINPAALPLHRRGRAGSRVGAI